MFSLWTQAHNHFLRAWTVTQVSHMALDPQENNSVRVSNRKLINRNTGPSPCHTQQPTSLQQVKAWGKNPHANPSTEEARQRQPKLLGSMETAGHVAPASLPR